MTNQDQFSKLPEPLIIHILSLLEMKDSVKTSVLAKSWKSLWTQVNNIVHKRFHDQDNEENMSNEQIMELRKINDDKWISFIDHTLMRCNVNIKSFSLAGSADFSLDVLDKWISHVLDKKVETLKLHINSDVPNCLFQSSSITNLELVHVEVYTSPTVHLSSLKSLVVESVYIDDTFIERILIGCPVLENLVIRDLSSIGNLNIMSPSVKILKLWNFWNGDDVVNIKAPRLQELKILEKFPFSMCELVDVSSLLKASLTFHTNHPATNESSEELVMDFDNWVTEYSWISMVTKLLIALSYVGELVIGSEPIQVLSLSKLSGTPSPLFMCKHLSIKTYLWKFDIPGIA